MIHHKRVELSHFTCRLAAPAAWSCSAILWSSVGLVCSESNKEHWNKYYINKTHIKLTRLTSFLLIYKHNRGDSVKQMNYLDMLQDHTQFSLFSQTSSLTSTLMSGKTTNGCLSFFCCFFAVIDKISPNALPIKLFSSILSLKCLILVHAMG